MNKRNTSIGLLLIIIIIFFVYLFFKPKNATAPVNVVSNTAQNTNIPQIEGNKDDLISFSIKPGQEVSGVQSINGSVKGGYFFEGNIGVNILDSNKRLIRQGHGTATTDWMTSGPVTFSGTIDLNGLPKGQAYIAIIQDNPKDGSINKQITIPIVIK